MRKLIVIALLLGSSACTFAATKNIKPLPTSGGLQIASLFYFSVAGDGINTTSTFNPRHVAPNYISGAGSLPRLPLVGVDGNGGNCQHGEENFPFTGTVAGGILTVTFSGAPPANTVLGCYINLFFQPE